MCLKQSSFGSMFQAQKAKNLDLSHFSMLQKNVTLKTYLSTLNNQQKWMGRKRMEKKEKKHDL
jgi:hypothetical protein